MPVNQNRRIVRNKKWLTIICILAIIYGLITVLMLPSLVIALVLGEIYMVKSFVIPMIIGLILAIPAAKILPGMHPNLQQRDGFLLVFLTWVFASLAGSIPYHLSPLNIGAIDAIFESTCGFATTGATTISDVEALPGSLLFWRSICHWAGGMGIVLLSVALMPILGIGGFQLIKAETPGPEKDKLTPRITEAAKILWGVYCIFTAMLALLYRIGGMTWFDAVCHGFTIMATGGVSTKNTGLGYYNSAYIDWVTVVFMFMGALNFNMYYRLARGKITDLVHHTESKVYFIIFMAAAIIISFCLIPQYGSLKEALRFGFFQTASILTSTGSIRTDYSAWPGLAQGILFCLMFIGGCSGSTAGGIKIIRWTVLFKQAGNELRRMIYPQGVFSIQLNQKVGRKDVVYGVAGFVFLYFMMVAAATLVTAASGFDIFSSFSAALSITGNIGAGFGLAGPGCNYSLFPGHLKLLYSLVMITGRLELWTVFVLFMPEYWRT